MTKTGNTKRKCATASFSKYFNNTDCSYLYKVTDIFSCGGIILCFEMSYQYETCSGYITSSKKSFWRNKNSTYSKYRMTTRLLSE